MEDFLLTNKERIKIFKLLTEHKTLNFNSIVKFTGIKSNKLSYQLNLMKQNNFIIKRDEKYSLSIEAQRLIPYFSQIFKKEVGVLPVILGIVRNENKILMIQRNKMPYKNYWGLFGGKQICGETIPETIEREVYEESNLHAHFKNYNGIVYETLKDNNYYKHSFFFIITSLYTNSFDIKEQYEGKVAWFNYQDVIDEKIDNVIPSDIKYLKKYSDKKIDIEHVVLEESDTNITIQ